MRRYSFIAAAAVAVLAGARVAYVLAQPGSDPEFARPLLDGAYYLQWADALAHGRPGVSGAYYLAPLYPWLLALWMAVLPFTLTALYLAQQCLVVATALLVGDATRRASGLAAGAAAAALVFTYHPFLYFASRPVGEAVGLLLLAASLDAAVAGARSGRAGWAAALASAGAIARPNFLAVPAAWGLDAIIRRKWKEAVVVAATASALLAPVVVRNALASGHLVPVSSNAGITLYHGNGPGASGGFTLPDGFSGNLGTQREEATALARLKTGRPLDDVAGDRYWGREALGVRISRPGDTLALAGTRLWLLVDDRELGLDYAPSLDANPLRHVAPVPFAVLFALAALGAARGFGAPETRRPWIAAAIGTALAPVVFYASSRYRLPFALVLCGPAGAGVAGLRSLATPGWRWRPAAAALLALTISFAAPSAGLARAGEATALANRAAALKAEGRLDEAERSARQGAARDPSAPLPRYNLAVILKAEGRGEEAAALFQEIVIADPGFAEAAGDLAALWIPSGRAREAIPILDRALGSRPLDVTCWTNLIVARITVGDSVGAGRALDTARARGVVLAPELAAAVAAAGAR